LDTNFRKKETEKMTAFETLLKKSTELQKKYEGSYDGDLEGRKILINAQTHLFLQVAGKTQENPPTIEGGYFGLNYKNAFACLVNCIQLIECEENLKAIKSGHKQPFGISWKY
jgi:hypothetical protein